MATLLLIRHGQTPNNVIGALDTARPGAPLTDLGERQARDIIRRLKGVHVDAVFASEHLRAGQTATPLSQERGLPLQRDARFGEIEAGELEMQNTPQAAREYLGAAFAWARGDFSAQVPGGPEGRETLDRFTQGVNAALADLPDDACAVIVSHGAKLRLWVSATASGITPEEAEPRRLLNTAILRVEGKPGDWRFVSWDDPAIIDADSPDPTASAD